jgi:hypothetical protein
MSTTMNSVMMMTTTTSSWYAMCAAEEECSRMRILRLSPAAWRAEANLLIRQTHPYRIQAVLAFVRKMDTLRANPPLPLAPPVVPEKMSAEDVDWNLWKDMVENPAKFGDDIIDWLELNEKLRAGPKKWRVAAYWLQKEQEKREKEEAERAPYRELYSLVAKQAAAKGMKSWVERDVKRFVARIHDAAVMIQAAVRGYQARSRMSFLNCCMCMSHRISPLETQVGMMCRACAEQGPHEDLTGPVADPWNWERADYVDWAAQNYEEMERCNGCGTWYPEGEMDSCEGYGKYCSRRCGPAGEARSWYD